MDANWTKEPWRVHKAENGGRYVTNTKTDEEITPSNAHDLTGECWDKQGYNDYNRMVLCVNACVNIEDPAEFVAEAKRLIAEEADLLAMPDAEVVPQETVDRILGITALRASHDRLANVLGAISEAQAKYYGYGGPLHLAMISLAKEAREALAAMPPA